MSKTPKTSEYTVRKFVDGKQVKELTEEQKKYFATRVIEAIGGRVIGEAR